MKNDRETKRDRFWRGISCFLATTKWKMLLSYEMTKLLSYGFTKYGRPARIEDMICCWHSAESLSTNVKGSPTNVDDALDLELQIRSLQPCHPLIERDHTPPHTECRKISQWWIPSWVFMAKVWCPCIMFRPCFQTFKERLSNDMMPVIWSDLSSRGSVPVPEMVGRKRNRD